MSAIWYRARAELRARWRAWLVLAVLTGVFAGGVIAVAAGARRTHSAYPRFIETTNAADMWVPNLPFGDIWAQYDFDELSRHPLVADSARGWTAFGRGETDGTEVSLFAADQALFRSLNAAKMLEGRLPREDAAHEVSLPFPLAEQLGLSVGDTTTWSFESFGAPVESSIEVVGVHAAAGDFPPVGDSLNAVGSPAFMDRYGERVLRFEILVVRLARGPAGAPEFHELLEQMGGGKVVWTVDVTEQTRDVQSSLQLQVAALWLVALIAGVSLVLVLGQAIARQSFLDAVDDQTLRSLGMSGSGLFGVALARGAVVAVASSVIAVGVAFALSPLTPRGVARLAEFSPGFSFDATAIGIGVAVLLVMIVGIAVGAGLRRVHRPVLDRSRTRPSVVARAMATGRARPTTVAGVRFALEPGGGRAAVPVRTTVASVALGLATLVGTLVFAGSLDHLLDTPTLYGNVWDDAFAVRQDAEGEDPFSPDLTPVAEDMRARDDLTGIAVGSRGIPLQVNSVPVNGIAMSAIEGLVAPPLLDGRLPAAEQEILLGAATLDRLDARIGDTVELSIRGGSTSTLEATIVGVGVIPPQGAQARFGEGLFSSHGLINTLAQRSPQLRGVIPPPDEIYVQYAEGVDRAAAERDIRATYADMIGPDFAGIEAADIVSFGRVRAMPFVLAGMLAALALATIVHALVTSVRRRRRELAVLRTLGFVRRQVRATVGWQSAALAVVTCVLALPVGIAIGRWGWLLFARSSGVQGEAVVPAYVALVAPAVLVVVLAVSWLPARAAARTQPAVVLRSE